MANKAGDILYGNYDRFTGEPFSTIVINSWYDGTAMDDTKVDNVIYFKNAAESGGYSRRSYTGPANVKWFGAKGDGITDDTESIRKCLKVCDKVFFEKGDYVLTSTINVTDKKIEITSSPNAYLNKRFVGQGMLVFLQCPDVYFNINIRNSLPQKLVFNDNGVFENIPQMRVQGIDPGIIFFNSCNHVIISHCSVTQIYSYSLFSITDGFIDIDNLIVDGECYVDMVIQTLHEERLKIRSSVFRNIALIPEKFEVLKNGVSLPQTFNGSLYGWQFGQALSIMGNNLSVKDCVFENISGLSIGADHQKAANLPESDIVIEGNRFIANSVRNRGSNPPGFIWIENHQSAIIRSNRFSFRKRAVNDGNFQLLRIAIAWKNTEIPYFEYSGNIYLSADASDNRGSINFVTRNDEAVINISGNEHYSPKSIFIYLDTIRESRPCKVINIHHNDVVCKQFFTVYNGQAFNGTYFKLPEQINISDNKRISASAEIVAIFGEYGPQSMELNVIGNNIPSGTRIGMFNGTFKANITDNYAPGTEVYLDYASTQSGTGEVTVKRNTLKNLTLVSSNTCIYRIEANYFKEVCELKNLGDSVVQGNTFEAQLLMSGTFLRSAFTGNTLKSRLVIYNLDSSQLIRNEFYGPGSGIYGTGNKNNISNTAILNNVLSSTAAYNFIAFSTDALFTGKNVVASNISVRTAEGSMPDVVNRPASANLLLSGNTAF